MTCARECPLCGGESKVIKTEDRAGETYRRRCCLKCKFRYTTVERRMEEVRTEEPKKAERWV